MFKNRALLFLYINTKPVSGRSNNFILIKKESVHISLALSYSSCIQATYFKFCADIPCSMDNKIINFVFRRNFILKKKFHLFAAHHSTFGNHFSVAGMPFSYDDHIMAYPPH